MNRVVLFCKNSPVSAAGAGRFLYKHEDKYVNFEDFCDNFESLGSENFVTSTEFAFSSAFFIFSSCILKIRCL